MGLDIWLGWPDKPAVSVGAPESEDVVDSLRFTYDRSRFNPLSQQFEAWAQWQLGGKGVYWILDLDPARLVPVDTRNDGSAILGIHPDWEQCEQRAAEALAQARTIPDRLFVVRTSQLRKPLDDYPGLWEAVEYYRREREKRKDRPKLIYMPPYMVYEDFQMTAGVFFGDHLPKIKATLLCRGPSGMELAFVCEGPEGVHEPYLRALDHIQTFIAHGKMHQAWICWSG